MNERAPSLCPRCGDLIGSEDDACANCGMKVGGASYKATSFWTFFLQHGSVTGVLIGTMVVIFFAMIVVQGSFRIGMQGFDGLRLVQCGALLPKELARQLNEQESYWRFVSAMFLHGGILHIGMNCFVLFQLGPMCANYFDQRRLFIIFVVSGITGAIASYFLNTRMSVGASGGVLGILAAILVRAKQSAGALDAMIYRQLMGWLIFIIVIGFIVPFVDWAAHLGGILGGGILGYALVAEGGARSKIHTAVFGLCVLIVVVSFGFAVRFAIQSHDEITKAIEFRRETGRASAPAEPMPQRVAEFDFDRHPVAGGRGS